MCGIASGEVVARPTHEPIGPAEPGPAPGKPSIVCLEPLACHRQLTRVEGEVGGKPLQEQRLGEDQPSGWRRWAVNQEALDLGPGERGPAFVTGKRGECARDLPKQQGTPREGISAQNGPNFIPLPIEKQTGDTAETW